MIQRDYVKAWSVDHPWRYSEMVEQDPKAAWSNVRSRLVDTLG